MRQQDSAEAKWLPMELETIRHAYAVYSDEDRQGGKGAFLYVRRYGPGRDSVHIVVTTKVMVLVDQEPF